MTKILVTIAMFLFCCTAGYGALAWDALEIEKDAKVEDASVEADFTCRNVGDKEVHILSATPSCGCTVAHLGHDVVAPGETTSVHVIFHLGDRIQEQFKYIVVMTDDPGNEKTDLTLRTRIATPFIIDHHSFKWAVDGACETRTATIHVADGYAIGTLAASCLNPMFSVTSREIVKGKEYEVSVTPRKTTSSEVSGIFITTDLPIKPRAEFKLYAMIK